jgi:hypothetical protein
MNYDARNESDVDGGAPSTGPATDAATTPEADAATTPMPDAEPPPANMTLVASDLPPFYIDNSESGSASWVAAVVICSEAGKRLCTGEEWDTACFAIGTELVGMDPVTGYEWVAELDGTNAYKRYGCGEVATHDYDSDSYEVRCCRDVP